MSLVPHLPGKTSQQARHHGILMTTTGVLVLSVDSLLVRLAATNNWTILFWSGLIVVAQLGLRRDEG
jgi:hypothetical protein